MSVGTLTTDEVFEAVRWYVERRDQPPTGPTDDGHLSWQWIAGYIDARGCLSAQPPGKGPSGRPYGFRFVFILSSLDRDMLEAICKRVGFGKVSPLKGRGTRQPSYIYRVTARGVNYLLSHVMPYLIVKRECMEAALTLMARRRLRRGQPPDSLDMELIARIREFNNRHSRTDNFSRRWAEGRVKGAGRPRKGEV